MTLMAVVLLDEGLAMPWLMKLTASGCVNCMHETVKSAPSSAKACAPHASEVLSCGATMPQRAPGLLAAHRAAGSDVRNNPARAFPTFRGDDRAPVDRKVLVSFDQHPFHA
jgi:hypothetical protein